MKVISLKNYNILKLKVEKKFKKIKKVLDK